MKKLCREFLCLVVFGLASGALYAGPVNINTADAETLPLELTGIGPALAQAIVEYRQLHGAFTTPEALMSVSGIGSRIVEMNRANILVGDS